MFTVPNKDRLFPQFGLYGSLELETAQEEYDDELRNAEAHLTITRF